MQEGVKKTRAHVVAIILDRFMFDHHYNISICLKTYIFKHSLYEFYKNKLENCNFSNKNNIATF